MRGNRATRLVAVLLAAGLAGCTDKGGVGGVEGGPLPSDPTDPTATTGASGAVGPTLPGGTSTSTPPPSAAPGGSAPTPPPASPTPSPPTIPSAGGLRLGGDDLGVTRVGAPFREAVAAVSAVLGRPVGDPPSDTACIGAEEEASWGSFRLASNGGRASGWRSTSTTLATPAGVRVGTPVAALRQAYGADLQVRPPAPDVAPFFVVGGGARLAGTLTGPADGDTVTALFNGTCESA